MKTSAVLFCEPDNVTTPEAPVFPHDTETRIRDGIARYRAWQRHSDATLAEVVLQLQHNQTARLRRTHAALLGDTRFAPITEFFLQEIYTGLDLDVLAREIERALPKAMRVLPDSVMRTAAIAVEANALTGEMDEAIAADLLAHQASADSDDAVIASYRRVGRFQDREEQMRLLRELGMGLDRYVRSRLISATFKMVKRPAHMAGFGGLYDFMAKGFAVMKPMKSVADFLDVFIGREQRILTQLENGVDSPLDLPDCELPA